MLENIEPILESIKFSYKVNFISLNDIWSSMPDYMNSVLYTILVVFVTQIGIYFREKYVESKNSETKRSTLYFAAHSISFGLEKIYQSLIRLSKEISNDHCNTYSYGIATVQGISAFTGFRYDEIFSIILLRNKKN